ncbi:V-set domain-containing T-cell activation inhibitor 1 isoform X3 [Notolabrus celidotus]|uniref:V-set domain-containing T-cell activation inhibitor 1 isoform X2 n=1 Tax=Notolabrus celidotus TaxID=1203425 RepID=UPI00148FE39D|nr:V-set domain-containing T-cell activation inhibitor 1 isoform X2 [Notolabrus celidotus]XP_034549159.1 V-set domain-containing T-cell activation inhibitor 1 isoform X3 [Notolabrus celidotus]
MCFWLFQSYMIILIVLFSVLIILLLALAFSDSSSEVTSTNTLPIANLGEDIVLSCYLNVKIELAKLREASVTWEKKGLTGVVHRYVDGADELADQNSQFKRRTKVFPEALGTGNASLLLRDVRKSDAGEYTCRMSSSEGKGTVNINLRAAAFTAPKFKFTKGVLVAEASRWFPKPNVTWSDEAGNVLNGSTSFKPNSAGIYKVVSMLQPVNISDTYTCRIENELVSAVSKATVTDTNIFGRTYFTFSAASSLLTSMYLSTLTIIIYICYLT